VRNTAGGALLARGVVGSVAATVAIKSGVNGVCDIPIMRAVVGGTASVIDVVASTSQPSTSYITAGQATTVHTTTGRAGASSASIGSLSSGVTSGIGVVGRSVAINPRVDSVCDIAIVRAVVGGTARVVDVVASTSQPRTSCITAGQATTVHTTTGRAGASSASIGSLSSGVTSGIGVVGRSVAINPRVDSVYDISIVRAVVGGTARVVDVVASTSQPSTSCITAGQATTVHTTIGRAGASRDWLSSGISSRDWLSSRMASGRDVVASTSYITAGQATTVHTTTGRAGASSASIGSLSSGVTSGIGVVGRSVAINPRVTSVGNIAVVGTVVGGVLIVSIGIMGSAGLMMLGAMRRVTVMGDSVLDFVDDVGHCDG